MLRLLATDEEDDVALGRVDVCIFQQKHAIYAIFLEDGELDEQADRTSQLLADNEVLLAPGLHAALDEALEHNIGTHAFEQGKQVFAGLVTAVVCISQGRHHAPTMKRDGKVAVTGERRHQK